MQVLPIIDSEFKALIPPLSGNEYEQLTQNILEAGQCYDAILLWNNLIVDGFNRFCICVTHGIGFKLEELQFSSREEAKLWIIENQLGRRNLTDAARIELALCKAELLREKGRENQSRAGKERHNQLFSKSSKANEAHEHVDVHKNIADTAGVGSGTLHRYNQIKKHGSPELLENVKSGKLKIGTAYKMLNTDSQLYKEMKAADKVFASAKELLATTDPATKKAMIEQLNRIVEKMRMALENVENVIN